VTDFIIGNISTFYHKEILFSSVYINIHTSVSSLSLLLSLVSRFLLMGLTPCSRILLEKLIITQLVKKFPTFHGN
jgi:hypothetical protein